MSVVELASAPGPSEFERTPPQDVAAEQCVLGGMLLSKDAIADVIEVVRGHDFYRPAHQIVYDAVIDLYGRGEPADAVTVAAELTKRGEVARIGGAPYLHTLISSVPTAANAGYYAQIVRERAILRRLVEAGTRIVQLAYSVGGDADDVVDQAQAEVYAVTDKRTSEDYQPLSAIMEGALDEIEAINSRGGQLSGVPTGFTELDQLMNGLHPGQLVVVAARPSIGKALALDTPLPTPSGWTTMGEVKVGDELLGPGGRPTTAVAASDVMHDRPCYRVEFSDGEAIVADASHLWRTTTRASRQQSEQRLPASYYWTQQQIDGLALVVTAAMVEPDRLVSTTDLIAEVGPAFRHVLRQHVIKHVPAVGSEPRLMRRLAGRRHYEVAYESPVPIYSRQQILKVLYERVTRPVGTSNTRQHEAVVTTEEIAATLYHENATERRHNHAVANAQPLQLPEADLPLPPYALGIWLGDGHSASARFTTTDSQVVANLEAEGLRIATSSASSALFTMRLPEPSSPPERKCLVCGRPFRPQTTQVRTCGRSCGGRARFVSGPQPPPKCPRCGGPATFGFRPCEKCLRKNGTVKAILRGLGVLENKHIPTIYLRASEAQRRSLLAGLLDSDGTAGTGGAVVFSVTSRRLAEDFRELAHSLGYRTGLSTKSVKGRSTETSLAYTVTFSPHDDVFRLERKRQAHSARRPLVRREGQRYIVDIQPIQSVPVRCVQVDNEDRLYLAGRSMIPTHNSTLALDLARAASIKHGLTSCVFSLEMTRNEITMRLLAAEARVALHTMRSGTMTDDDWTRLARRMGEVSSAPLFIDDSPNMSMMEIRAKCRRLKQRHDLRLVVVDYLQLLSSPRRVENRQQEVSEFSRQLKLLAKELDVPVVALSQLNRGPEQRADKRPQLSDLRESGAIEQDSDVVVLLHREDAYERESPRAGEADFIVAKHRNGPTAVVTVAFQGHYSRFVDMAVG